MQLEHRKLTGRRTGTTARGAARSGIGMSALVALALVGCGSEGAGTETVQDTATPASASTAAANTMMTAAAGAAAPASSATNTTSAAGSSMTASAGGATTTPGAPAASQTPAASGAANAQPASGAAMQMDPASTTMAADPADAMDPADMTGAMPAVTLPEETGTPTLFWLEITSNAAYTAAADGSGQKRFASGSPMSAPDGVAVDPVDGHVFILNMGTVLGGANTGSLVRYNLDGSSPEVLMPPGSMADGETFNTGKQVSIDKVNRKLYMGDREGSKVWRIDLDGKNLECLVSGHGILQVVGVSPDPIHRYFYFSDRNGKKLFRASMDMPAGKTHADRDDVELLYVDSAPTAMPLDIELDLEDGMMFWTDRQQSKVFGMHMDIPDGQTAESRDDVKTVASGLADVIGLGYDHENKVLYATHSGSVSMFKADGSDQPKRIGSSGRTGLAFAKIP